MSVWPWPRRRSAIAITKILGGGGGGKTPPGRGRGGNGGKGPGGGASSPQPTLDTSSISSTFVGNDIATSFSWSHTCTGASMLVVAIAHATDTNVNNVKYNNVTMTLIGRKTRDSGLNSETAEMYYLLAPSSGANTILVTLNAAAPGNSNYVGMASSWVGANAIGTEVDQALGTTDPDPSLVPTTGAKDVVVDCLAGAATGSSVFTCLQTQMQKRRVSSGTWTIDAGHSRKNSTGGTTTVGWSRSGQILAYAYMAVPLKPS